MKELKKTVSQLLILVCLMSVSCGVDQESKSQHFLSKMKARDYFSGSLQIKLARAIEEESIPDIRALITQGADVNAVGKKGMSPVFWALVKQKYNSFEILLGNGADPNLVTEKKVEKKLYPNRPDTKKISLMELVATMDDPRYLRLALQYGGNPNTQAHGPMLKGLTVLFSAIEKGNMENVNALIDAGADVNFVNTPGSNSPLGRARAYCRYDIVKQLIEKGADPGKILGKRMNGSPQSFALDLERFGFSSHFSLSDEEELDQRSHYLDVVNYLKKKNLLEENFDPWFRQKQAKKGKTEIIIHEERPEWWPDFPEP